MSADFWSSYLSGAIGIIIGNPLDIIKTRLQASFCSPSSAPASPIPSISLTTSASTPNFPTPTSLLRGSAAPILGYGALNSILFVVYNRCLNALGEEDFSNPTNLGKVWTAGAAGGLATFVVSAPTELVKCRAQVVRQGDARGGPVTSWGIAKDIWKREGLRGLYFGGGVTSVRDAVGYGF
jgi:solute carrier family 25 (mitochondrial carnitine/acylcarnitine transporter), member 20/29